ncbi:MAG TPA: alanine--tRNA ligase-related protein, partial [Phycisphaerae bacterium]|nr:alanine--tRNA ligase-related protein [Phycisphaerae bacterium]
RQQLTLNDPFLHKLVPVVVQTMSDIFPELKKNPQHVADIIKDEEISFGKTLDRGIALFEDAAERAPTIHFSSQSRGPSEVRIITGEDAFKLYDTYGFPVDLTRIMAEERGMRVDMEGYEREMEKARVIAQGAQKGAGNAVYDLPPNILAELENLRVHATDDSLKYKHGPARATIAAIWNGIRLDENADASDARPGEQIAVILDKTNFYAEMGGQVGDGGELRSNRGDTFVVETARVVGHYVLHIGHVKRGKLTVGDAVTASVMGGRGGRDSTEKNHTSTHLANWALREILGEHVQQKGSLVDPEKLRFDFLHQKSMADDEIARVETMVNGCIEQKLPVYAEVAPQELALKIHGLRAVFGEKYPPMVRVVSIGVPVADLLKNPANPEWQKYSIEFCGGTHLASADVAERFVVTSEESVSKGVRRIVALTGAAAKDAATHGDVIQSLLTASKSAPDDSLAGAIAALQKAIAEPHTPLLAKRRAQAAIAELQDRQKKHQKSQASTKSEGGFDHSTLLTRAESVSGVSLIVADLPPGASADALRSTWDWLKRKHPEQHIAVLLASEFTDTDKDGNRLPPKVNLLAAVGDPLVNKLKAGDWIKAIAPIVGGTGGGRPQLAMAGGKDVSKLHAALDAGKAFAKERLK